MFRMAFTLLSLCFISLFCLVLLEDCAAAQTTDIKLCSDIVNSKSGNYQESTNNTKSYINTLVECLQIQQNVIEETKLNLSSLIVNLKSSKEKRYIFHKVKMNWTESVESCHADGQVLASIRSKPEHDKYVENMPKGSQNDTYWIGGFDPTNRGHFVWMSKDALRPVQLTYQSWAEGQPQRTCGSEYDECISSLNISWVVTQCATRNYYACEYFSVPLTF